MSRRRRSDTKPRSNATKGYGGEFGWLASANVTFTTKSHRNFKPYPASAKMPRAFAPLFHSAKVRLRATRFAQNDIQNDCSAITTHKRGRFGTALQKALNSAFCTLHSFICFVSKQLSCFVGPRWPLQNRGSQKRMPNGVAPTVCQCTNELFL